VLEVLGLHLSRPSRADSIHEGTISVVGVVGRSACAGSGGRLMALVFSLSYGYYTLTTVPSGRGHMLEVVGAASVEHGIST